jgi:hypothetical protein
MEKSEVLSRELKLSPHTLSKPMWAIPLCLVALAVVSGILLVSRSRTLNSGNVTVMQSSPVLQQRITFHDTLEYLYQITSKALQQSQETMMLADSQYHTSFLPPSDCKKRLESGFSKADLTSVHLE